MASALPLLLVGGAALLIMGSKKKNGAAAKTSPTPSPEETLPEETPPLEICGKMKYLETYKGIPLYGWAGVQAPQYVPGLGVSRPRYDYVVGVCPSPKFEPVPIAFEGSEDPAMATVERVLQKAKLRIDTEPERVREIAGLK